METDDIVFIENGPSMTLIRSLPKNPEPVSGQTNASVIELAATEDSTTESDGGHLKRLDHVSPQGQDKTVSAKVHISKNVTADPPFSHARISSESFSGQIQYEKGNLLPIHCKPPPCPIDLPYRVKDQDLSPEECAAIPPPPPPPPSLGVPTFPTSFAPMAHMLPPPPPPPIQMFPTPFTAPVNPADDIMTPGSLLPIQYSGDYVLETGGRILRIVPLKRNVFVTRHRAHAADFQQHRWILQYGSSNFWYAKPTRSYMKSIRKPEDLAHLLRARPVSLETPRIFGSRAMTTPTDDDIYECSLGHEVNGGFSGACNKCTNEKSNLLDNVSLVYYLVLSTCQASEPFIPGAHFNGCEIYKLVKCGSREAAVAEAFYAAGVNGWNIVFTCVMRLGEDFEERNGNVKRVEELWNLADDEEDQETIRVFY